VPGEAGPRVSTFLVRALVEVVERAGVMRGELMTAAKLDVGRLDDIVGGFELAEFAALQTTAMEVTADEALGLHLAEQASEAAFDVVAHLAMHAPTLRDAIALCAQFQRLVMDGTALSLREHGDAATLSCEFPRTTVRADRMLAEFALGGLARMIQSFLGHGAHLRIASFEHPKPAHAHAYARLFGGAVRFSQKLTGLELARELLDRRQLHHHPELFSVLHTQAEAKLDGIVRGQGFVDKVKQHLLSLPPSRMPDMGVVARSLGISARSLRRRLAEQDVSYKALLQSVLEARATQMLGDPNRSIQETAHAMGFSDPAAFQRAFKRWKGITPGEFKKAKR
jgi:AraC-like DNA-binding protein